MRSLLLFCCLACLIAGEANPAPPAFQKLIDTSSDVARKAREAYVQAVRKEQEKLVAALQKEQEKTTKKGDLEGALLIKGWVEKIQNGSLLTPSDAGANLLGDDMPKTPVATASGLATLATNCAAAAENQPNHHQAPKEIEALLNKATRLVLPKGDGSRYTFTCTAPGLVAIWTGAFENNNGDLWSELEKSGFKRAPAIENGNGVWWILEAKVGAQFTAFDPARAAAAMIFAGGFTRQK